MFFKNILKQKIILLNLSKKEPKKVRYDFAAQSNGRSLKIR